MLFLLAVATSAASTALQVVDHHHNVKRQMASRCPEILEFSLLAKKKITFHSKTSVSGHIGAGDGIVGDTDNLEHNVGDIAQETSDVDTALEEYHKIFEYLKKEECHQKLDNIANGTTLEPGVYCGDLHMQGTITLQGKASLVELWAFILPVIWKVTEINVILKNSSSCQVFFISPGGITISASNLVGTIITSDTMDMNGNFEGQLISLREDIEMRGETVENTCCTAPPPTPAPTPAPPTLALPPPTPAPPTLAPPTPAPLTPGPPTPAPIEPCTSTTDCPPNHYCPCHVGTCQACPPVSGFPDVTFLSWNESEFPRCAYHMPTTASTGDFCTILLPDGPNDQALCTQRCDPEADPRCTLPHHDCAVSECVSTCVVCEAGAPCCTDT